MTVKAKPAAKRVNAAPARKAAKPVSTDPAAPVIAKTKAAKTEKSAKSDKPKKVKMIRDSFTMPEVDYEQIAELKKKCLQAGVHVKKSELLRAGLLGLSKLSEAALLKAVDQVEKIKTGRPAKQ